MQNLKETLKRKKQECLDFDAYITFENLKVKLNFALNNFEAKYVIKF